MRRRKKRDEYRSVELSEPPAPPLSQAVLPVPRSRNLPRKEKADGSLAVPKSNIGYKLLEKAGWSGQGGIGAYEQGRMQPIQAEVRQGNIGLGFEPKKKKKISKESNLKLDSKETEKNEARYGGGGGSKANTRKLSTFPRDELADEDVETKVKRVKQVMQTESDEKAGKELARLVYSAFRDDGNGRSTTDENPLLRRDRKISARNPLL